MISDKVIRTAFLISFAGHCLFLGVPGFNPRLPCQEKKPDEITINVEIERSALLPKIDIMGEEKKFKEVIEKSKQPEPESKPHPRLEEIAVEEPYKDLIKEKFEVIVPAQEAMFRYQDMVKQKIESCRRYPAWAKEQKLEGVSCLVFTLLSNGMVQDIKLIRSSGFDILDKEAISTVKRASPFCPIPAKLNYSSFTMEVSLVFKLE